MAELQLSLAASCRELYTKNQVKAALDKAESDYIGTLTKAAESSDPALFGVIDENTKLAPVESILGIRQRKFISSMKAMTEAETELTGALNKARGIEEVEIEAEADEPDIPKSAIDTLLGGESSDAAAQAKEQAKRNFAIRGD